MLTNIWNLITGTGSDHGPITAAMETMVDSAGGLIGEILPVGIGLMFVIAIPRIVRRVINTFL